MSINNYKDFLNEATQLPVKIESVLPTNAPKISTMLNSLTNNLPTTPNFPTALPDLPPLPATLPGSPINLPLGGTLGSSKKNGGSPIRVINATSTILPMQDRSPDVNFLERHTQVQSGPYVINYK